jgi:hypothetical protein
MPVNGPGAVPWAAFDTAIRDITDRVARVEAQLTAATGAATARRNRGWLIVMGVMTGLVCPVVVTGILTVFHLASQS